MPRPPPPQNPHPRRRALNPQSSAPLRRSPAPCKSFVPPPPTPAKKRQFAPRALSRYNGAAKRKILRIRREPIPRHQPRKKSRQFAPGALSRYNSAAKTERPAARPPAKRSRGEKSPHPPGTHTPHRPTQQKNPGRLPRSATFPLFKRRKMRYTGKEIHPDTEDET